MPTDQVGTVPLFTNVTKTRTPSVAQLRALALRTVTSTNGSRTSDDEDVVQDVMLAMLRRQQADAEIADAGRYASGIARRLVFRTWRDRERWRRVFTSSPDTATSEVVASDPANPYEQIEEADAQWRRRKLLARGLRRLTLRQQQCIQLVDYEQLTVREAARLLGLGPATVAEHVTKARASLRASIEGTDTTERVQTCTETDPERIRSHLRRRLPAPVNAALRERPTGSD